MGTNPHPSASRRACQPLKTLRYNGLIRSFHISLIGASGFKLQASPSKPGGNGGNGGSFGWSSNENLQECLVILHNPAQRCWFGQVTVNLLMWILFLLPSFPRSIINTAQLLQGFFCVTRLDVCLGRYVWDHIRWPP